MKELTTIDTITKDVLVFRTNISGKADATRVSLQLKSMQGVYRVDFDLDDCDRVMRIEAKNVSPRSIESFVLMQGFICSELED